jgi:hypothetical protein
LNLPPLEFIIPPSPETRGRHAIFGTPMSSRQHNQRHRALRAEQRLSNVAILDMETDPFDPETKAMICPFLAVLYSDNFEPIIIWEPENDTAGQDRFANAVVKAISDLPDQYTVYAHNGGKFDYMFFIHLIRGKVSFKGRGIMACKIGPHELRDSLHIIPEKLAAWKKDVFDYTKLRASRRGEYKQAIIQYCINDCRYLLEIVQAFLTRYGFKLSIGQAAMAALRQHYKVKTIGENYDTILRQFFFGGRVECLRGRGYWRGDYKLYDVNSMYPFAMANYQHPISNEYVKRRGVPDSRTVFLDLDCHNRGALVRRNDDNETSANETSGRFFTTIWEYETALKYGLISNVKIHWVIDCMERSDFSRFVVPLYEFRQGTKARLKTLPENSPEYEYAQKDDLFFKYLLNNAYGKFAQNPRRYKESYITDPNHHPYIDADEYDDKPPPRQIDKSYGPLPVYECNRYWIWERPQEKLRFNNVGTAASITGAARAILLEAIQNAVDPIYCDTDSIICKSLSNVTISPTQLGAWDLEKSYSEIIITGKKQYACKVADLPDGHPRKFVVKSKGVSGLVWNDYVRMLSGDVIHTINKAPTLTRFGAQFYMKRDARATASIGLALQSPISTPFTESPSL